MTASAEQGNTKDTGQDGETGHPSTSRSPNRTTPVREDGKGDESGSGSASAEASTSELKGEQEQQETTTKTSAEAAVDDSHPWQAVWDATRGAWYFWNAHTQETTWENPLQSKGGSATAASGKTAEQPQQQINTQSDAAAPMTDEEVALACGIDPDLAFLDPRMYAAEIQQARARGIGGSSGAASSSSSTQAYSIAGAFDSRTGRFVPHTHVGPGGLHDPSRLAHAAQADRQLGAFFDVEQYREQRKREHDDILADDSVQTDADGRVKRRAPTRKELKQYKERAKEKKAAKHAWLRN